MMEFASPMDTSLTAFIDSLLAPDSENEDLEAFVERMDADEAARLLDQLDGIPPCEEGAQLRSIKVVTPPDMMVPRTNGDAPPGLETFAAYTPLKTSTPPRKELDRHTTVALGIKLGLIAGYEVGMFDPQALRWHKQDRICGPFLISMHEVSCRVDTDWMPYIVGGQETPTFQFPINNPVEKLHVHLAVFFQMDFHLISMAPIAHKSMPFHGGVTVWAKLTKEMLPPLWREGIHVFRLVVSDKPLHVADGIAQTTSTASCALSPFFRVKGALPVLGHRTFIEGLVRKTALAVANDRLVG